METNFNAKKYIERVIEEFFLGMIEGSRTEPTNEQESYEVLSKHIAFVIKEDLIKKKLCLKEAFDASNYAGATLWDLIKDSDISEI